MSLRVIAGTAKGRKLKSVPGDSTRPIMDRVKEALFSILGTYVNDANFLDLFGGTGSVGIEALSRGAKKAVFCELNRNALQTIRENLQHTQLDVRGDVRALDAFDMLRKPADTTFDYIYIAPPQYQGLWRKALELLDENPDWLDTDGIIVVQIHRREREDLPLKNLIGYDERKYGNTVLLFYERADASPKD